MCGRRQGRTPSGPLGAACPARCRRAGLKSGRSVGDPTAVANHTGLSTALYIGAESGANNAEYRVSWVLVPAGAELSVAEHRRLVLQGQDGGTSRGDRWWNGVNLAVRRDHYAKVKAEPRGGGPSGKRRKHAENNIDVRRSLISVTPRTCVVCPAHSGVRQCRR